MKEDLLALSSKLNSTVDKAENSFQQYELLYYEVGTIKKSLLATAQKITQQILSQILIIKNPNEAIYLLMKMFYRIIRNENEDDTDASWEKLQKLISFKLFSKYIAILSETNAKGLTKEELDEAMPFLVNYEKLSELFVKFSDGKGLQMILDFIKTSVDYNVKLNIIKNLYASNLNKNTKINSIQTEVTALSTFGKEATMCVEKMEADLKALKTKVKTGNGNTGGKVYGLGIITKYNVHMRYNVLIEMHSSSHFKQKYIIRLKSKYKERDSFVREIVAALSEYEGGKTKNFDNKTVTNILNASSDKSSYIIDNMSTKNRNGFNYFYPKNFLNKFFSRSRLGYTSDNIRSYGSTGYKESDADEEETNNNLAKTSSRIKVVPISSGKLDGIKSEEVKTQRTKVTDKENEGTNKYTSREMSHRNYLEGSNSANSALNNNSNTVGNLGSTSINNVGLNSTSNIIHRMRGGSAGKAKNQTLKIESNKIELNSYYCCKF